MAHRVDADGYTTVVGLRRHIDQSLPGTPGTLDASLFNNMTQEEICLAVEYAGLTVYGTGAADQSAGWGQLRAAIFTQQAITNLGLSSNSVTTAKIVDANVTNVKIADLNVNKLDAGTLGLDQLSIIDTIGGDLLTWQQSIRRLWYSELSGGSTFTGEYRSEYLDLDYDLESAHLTYDALLFDPTSGITVEVSNTHLQILDAIGPTTRDVEITIDRATFEEDDSVTREQCWVDHGGALVTTEPTGGGSTRLGMKLSYEGLEVSGTDEPSSSAFKNMSLRWAGYAYTGAWTSTRVGASGTAGAYNYQTSSGIDTGLPPATEVLSCNIYYNNGSFDVVVPCHIQNVNRTDPGGTLIINSIKVLANNATDLPPTSGENVTIMYDASGF